MENSSILTHSELLVRLNGLKLDREIQETSLKYTFTEYINSINITSFFKSSDKPNTFQTNDLVKTGLHMAINMVTGLVLGKNRSIKGYLSTMMVKRLTNIVIDNNLINVISKIGFMFLKKKD